MRGVYERYRRNHTHERGDHHRADGDHKCRFGSHQENDAKQHRGGCVECRAQDAVVGERGSGLVREPSGRVWARVAMARTFGSITHVPIGPMIARLPKATAIHPVWKPHVIQVIANPAIMTRNALTGTTSLAMSMRSAMVRTCSTRVARA